MAGDWIKLRSNIKDDPDVVLMAGALSIDEFAVVGRLHAVWAWLDQHSSTGTNVRITSAYLDRLTACPGFADAMRAVDWLRGRDGDLEFPDFERHNGESAKRRATETKRKREQRDKSPTESGTNVPEAVPLNTGPEKRREEIVINTHSERAHESPTAEEVKAYAASAPLPISEACAVAFHDTQQAAGWITKHGHSIADWRASLRRYASIWNENEKSKSGHNGHKTEHRPKRTLEQLAGGRANDIQIVKFDITANPIKTEDVEEKLPF